MKNEWWRVQGAIGSVSGDWERRWAAKWVETGARVTQREPGKLKNALRVGGTGKTGILHYLVQEGEGERSGAKLRSVMRLWNL